MKTVLLLNIQKSSLIKLPHLHANNTEIHQLQVHELIMFSCFHKITISNQFQTIKKRTLGPFDTLSHKFNDKKVFQTENSNFEKSFPPTSIHLYITKLIGLVFLKANQWEWSITQPPLKVKNIGSGGGFPNESIGYYNRPTELRPLSAPWQQNKSNSQPQWSSNGYRDNFSN